MIGAKEHVGGSTHSSLTPSWSRVGTSGGGGADQMALGGSISQALQDDLPVKINGELHLV